MKTAFLLLALLGGVSTAWADEVTIAEWQANKTWEQASYDDTNKIYYYQTSNTVMTNDVLKEETFSNAKPYFYPLNYAGSDMTRYYLTLWSYNTNNKWYVQKQYNDGSFRFNRSTPTIANTEYLDGTKHVNNSNYLEIGFPATGYKNLKLTFKFSGHKGYYNLFVVVSTDGGTTWQYGGNSYVTGNAYNNFNTYTVNLGVDNCSDVKVRIVEYLGGGTGDVADWYQKDIKVVGEAYNSELINTVTPGTSANGIVQLDPIGGTYVAGTSVTATASPYGYNVFSKWSDDKTDNPYTFTPSANVTLTPVFLQGRTLTTSINTPWAGTITRSPDAEVYEENTVVTLTANANSDFSFSSWSTGEITKTITVTMNEAKSITANFTKNLYSMNTEDVKIANWTFDGNYDIASNTYTPTGLGHANYKNTFSSQVPTIRPDYYAFGTDISSYAMTLKCADAKEWKLEDFNSSNRYIFSFDSADDMATVSDYTNPSQQTHYFEASFPTTGFNDVKISLSIAAHSEPTGMTYGVVYSTDNGTTWTTAGTVTTQISSGSSHWNYWNSTPSTISLGSTAANKEKVIVRVVRQRSSYGETGVQGQNNKLDYFTVTGTVDADQCENLNENTDYTPVAKTTTVHLTRTINAGNWSTIVLPFALTDEKVKATFGEHVKLAQFTGYNSSTKVLTMSEATTMNANEPYFIKVAEDEYTSPVEIQGVNIVASGNVYKDVSGVRFQGVYVIGKIPSGAYFANNNNLYQSNGSSNIKPFRAYFTNVPSGARLSFFDDETTSISEKGIVNSEKFLTPEGMSEQARRTTAVYDLQGRRVRSAEANSSLFTIPFSLKPGVYIVNGKRVIIK